MTGTSEICRSTSVVDLFCGVGGLSYGFKKYGFQVDAGVDLDESCRYPFESNVEAPFIRTDVAKLDAPTLDELFAPGKTKVLVGCAPCQPFSTYNQKNSDPKWRLLNAFGNLIDKTRPEVVSMENVPQLLQFRGGKIFNKFLKTLEKAGYQCQYDILYGPDFGLPQGRSRLVLLGSLLGDIKLPKPTHKRKHRTVRDVLAKLPEIKAGQSHPGDPLHKASRLSETNLKRIRASKPGGTWRNWHSDLVADCHKSESGRGYASVYGRMRWDEPSPTVTTQFFGFGNGRFGHPEQDRALSLREGAILQGFPKKYKFVPPGEEVKMQGVGRLIGNAVPVNLAKAIAKSVANHLTESLHG